MDRFWVISDSKKVLCLEKRSVLLPNHLFWIADMYREIVYFWNQNSDTAFRSRIFNGTHCKYGRKWPVCVVTVWLREQLKSWLLEAERDLVSSLWRLSMTMAKKETGGRTCFFPLKLMVSWKYWDRNLDKKKKEKEILNVAANFLLLLR